MKLKKCPKCYTNAYEHLDDASLCHACNYHSADGYRWGKCYDANAYRALVAKKLCLPIDVEEKENAVSVVASQIVRNKSDRKILKQALRELTPFRRALVYLRFWCGYDENEIARVLRIQEWEVRSFYLKTLAQLRERLWDDPNFSGNRIRNQMEAAFTARAA